MVDVVSFLAYPNPIIDLVFGSGKIVFARLFIASILTFFIYKFTARLFKSPTISFIVGLVVSILGLRMIDESLLLSLMTGYYAFIIMGVFVLLTIFIRTAWWIRKTLLLVMAAVFAVLWYFYDKNTVYLLGAIICFIFLVFDGVLHSFLAKLRKGENEARELDIQIKLEQSKLGELVEAGGTEKEIEEQKKKILELNKERNKYL
jgi:hypothetical protein